MLQDIDERIQALAGEWRAQFEMRTRDNGTDYWVRKEIKDDALAEACHQAHGDMFPDDWRYQFIVDALDALEQHDDPDEARDSLEPNIYTASLTAWLASSNYRPDYVDQACDEYGGDCGTTTQRIALGQLAEILEVFDSIRNSLRDAAATAEDCDED